MPARQGPQELPRTFTFRSVEKGGAGGAVAGQGGVASQDIPGSDHKPGTRWAGLSCL